MIRHVRTTQELRNLENDGGADGLPVAYRRRGAKVLPTAYSDLSPRRERCWKRTRRVRWVRLAQM